MLVQELQAGVEAERRRDDREAEVLRQGRVDGRTDEVAVGDGLEPREIGAHLDAVAGELGDIDTMEELSAEARRRAITPWSIVGAMWA